MAEDRMLDVFLPTLREHGDRLARLEFTSGEHGRAIEKHTADVLRIAESIHVVRGSTNRALGFRLGHEEEDAIAFNRWLITNTDLLNSISASIDGGKKWILGIIGGGVTTALILLLYVLLMNGQLIIGAADFMGGFKP